MYGSDEKTSSAAPAIVPERMASASASSSTSSPRAALTMRTPGRMLANAARPRKPVVSSVSGRCSVRKSAAANTSSGVEAYSAPSSRNRSGATNGS